MKRKYVKQGKQIEDEESSSSSPNKEVDFEQGQFEDLEEKEEKILQQTEESQVKYLWLYGYTDLSVPLNVCLVVVLRVIMAMTGGYVQLQADQYWQSTEVAYDMVFGGGYLPWEWLPEYRIRNALYPIYLSLPLRILKFLHLDYYYTLYPSYLLFHLFLVLLGDYHFYSLGCKTIGKPATRIALYLYFSSKFLNMYLVQTFGNSVETILLVITFHYYVEISHKFDKNVCIVAFLAVFSFMIRCTSPIGWVPLILYKVIFKKAICSLLLAGLVVGLPTLALCTALDSFFYGTFTFTPYNFLEQNIIEKVSEQFGVYSPSFYMLSTLPRALNFFFIFLLAAIVFNFYKNLKKRKCPEFALLVLTMLLAFSSIPHKEDRFILPTFPILFLIFAEFVHKMIRKFGQWVQIAFMVCIVIEVVLSASSMAFNNKISRPLTDIMSVDPNPHQIYVGEKYDFPAYSLIHSHQNENRVELLFSYWKGGTFGMPDWFIPDVFTPLYQCRDLLNSLDNGFYPPKYVILQVFIVDKLADGYKGVDCFRRMETHYDLIKVYKTPWPRMKTLLGYSMKEQFLYQKKHSGQRFVLDLT